jgi:uncharacterized membrane protein
MAEIADKRETGASLMFIGVALWVADLLVVFFAPGARTAQQHTSFNMIMALLFLLGVWFMLRGVKIRKQSAKE